MDFILNLLVFLVIGSYISAASWFLIVLMNDPCREPKPAPYVGKHCRPKPQRLSRMKLQIPALVLTFNAKVAF